MGCLTVSQSLSYGNRTVHLTVLIDAVKEGHLFSCMVYSDTEYAELTVLFTGMPVMRIDGDMGAEGTQISLFDPIFGADGEYRSLQSSAYYNIRGNASKRFEKIGYKLELLENDGTTKRKETLLGMRKDDSWQLKALVFGQKQAER